MPTKVSVRLLVEVGETLVFEPRASSCYLLSFSAVTATAIFTEVPSGPLNQGEEFSLPS